MKKLIFILVFVSLLGTFFWNSPTPTVTETPLQNLETHHKSVKAQIQTNTAKVLAVMPQEYTEKKEVPKEETGDKWMQELENYVTDLDRDHGGRRYRAFAKAHEDFKREMQRLTQQGQSNQDELKLEKEIARNLYLKQTKLIFGKYYPEIKQFSRDFEDSDPGFAN